MKHSIKIILGVTMLSFALLTGCQDGSTDKKTNDETVQHVNTMDPNKTTMHQVDEKANETPAQ